MQLKTSIAPALAGAFTAPITALASAGSDSKVARSLAAAGLALAAAGAFAAPRAQSAAECGIAADMAIVARSLAAEDIERGKADTIMARIYDVSASERGRELMKEIVDAAYAAKNAAAGGSAQTFAENLYATCLKSGGDMDPVLGKKL